MTKSTDYHTPRRPAGDAAMTGAESPRRPKNHALLLALALAAPAVAFTPAVAPRKIVRGGRPLGPGFLKDLGFEKPSWLPDFGGGDDKPAEEPKAEEEAEEAEEAEAASE